MKEDFLDKHIWIVLVSICVAILTHFPELFSLFDISQNNIFPDMRVVDVVVELLFTFLSLLIIFCINIKLFGFDKSFEKRWYIYLLSFVVSLFFSGLLGKLFVFMHHRFNIPAIDSMLHNYLHPFRDVIFASIVVVSCYLSNMIRRNNRILMEHEKMKSLMIQCQYDALKSQLNPHMLFNSLNTLRALIREDSDVAQKYLQELSRVLRYSLQGSSANLVSLHEELELAYSYIYLLKMRYEENLNFSFSIEEPMKNRFLPPLSLQILIENAVKHNEISTRNPLLVEVIASDGVLSVRNLLQPKRSESVGANVGLTNLSKRYEMIAHKNIDIYKSEKEFVVTIPLL